MEIKKQTNLRGTLTVPGDKSISHRAVMFGSLANATTRITHFLEGADCLSTISCFRKMGIDIDRNGDEILVSFIIIRTYGDEWKRDVKNDWFFESDEEIDREFMNLVESEFSEEEQFLHHPEVIKYLDIFGIYEKSPYIYSAEEWLIGPLFKDEAPVRERFVWAFPY